MFDYPHTVVQLPPNRSLYKKGEYFDCFYEVVSGEVTLTISQNQLVIRHPIILGDYQILEGINYRLSLIKTLTKCVIKVYDLKYYQKMDLKMKEYERAFDKFKFRSKLLKYLLKKLYFLTKCKRNDIIGHKDSLGIILEGSFKIYRNIPIVKMKAKNLQLLKKFQICLMSSGQIFQGSLICESTTGIVGICQSQYKEQLSKNFEEFAKILQLSTFKGEVHNSLEKDIAFNCKKKPKIFSNMVPLPLKDQISLQKQDQTNKEEQKQKKSSRELKHVSAFELENSFAEFLHKQWRKGLSLSTKKREVSPPPIRRKKSPREKKPYKKMTVDITNPAIVNFQMFNDLKKIKSQTKILTTSHKLPGIHSTRFRTEGNDLSNIIKKKYLYFL